MKKILLGTTALVAATAMTAGAAKADMSITGWSTFGMGASNMKGGKPTATAPRVDPSNGDFDIYENGEIYFNGTTEMDNGMSLSWDVQLETENGNGNFIDENYFTISDEFGSIIIGQENLPNYKMHYSGGWATGSAGISSNSYSQFTGSPGGISYFHDGFMNDTAPIGNDSDMISYYTPRISGFQLGVGYMPDNDQNDTNKTDASAMDDKFEHTVSVGANYTADMSGTSVAVSGGYTTSDIQGKPENTARKTDYETYQAGLRVGVGGLSLGLSYMSQNDKYHVTPAGDSTNYMAGIKYATGPHTFGISGVLSEADATKAIKKDTKGEALMLAHDYALGGGVSLTSSIVFLDVKAEEKKNNGDGQAAMVYLNAGF